MKVIKTLLKWLGPIVLVAIVVGILLFRGLVTDSVRALQYEPTPLAQDIARNVEFTWLGKLYFFASHPVIDQTNRASTKCGVEKSSAILGCYASGTIYIYDIDNTELKDVEEVTAAHEMLHAAYVRLNNSERQRVDDLLFQESEALQDNPQFMKRLAAYDDLDQPQKLNELHSIIGTEVTNISSELSQYYARYFINREKISTMYQSYSSVFFELEETAKQLANDYNDLVEERNRTVEAMNQRYDLLQTRIQSLDQRSQPTFAEVSEVNRDINDYNISLVFVKRQLTEFDNRLSQLKLALESSAAHQDQLNKTIDSSLAPATQL